MGTPLVIGGIMDPRASILHPSSRVKLHALEDAEPHHFVCGQMHPLK